MTQQLFLAMILRIDVGGYEKFEELVVRLNKKYVPLKSCIQSVCIHLMSKKGVSIFMALFGGHASKIYNFTGLKSIPCCSFVASLTEFLYIHVSQYF